MIHVYDGNASDFEVNGAAILAPESCTIKEIAGGSYELSLVHPIDEHGTWKYLQTGYIIKAPVPVATTEQIIQGDYVDVYKAASTTELRAKPSAPSKVNYPAWVNPDQGSGEDAHFYSKGEKVSYNGVSYQCILTPTDWFDCVTPPPYAPSFWSKINDYSGGAAVLLTLKKSTEVYLVSKYNGSWYRVVTKSGIEGYVQTSALVFVERIKVEPVDERTVSDQLFRIYDISINSKNMRVSVSARHVSYDLAGNIIGDCVLVQQPPSTALALMQDALLNPVDFTLATNLTEDNDGAYSGTHTYQNGIAALLDPDSGFVGHYKARLFRDNWDMFIYRNSVRNRGVRLEYGKNLKGVTWKRNTDKLINRVMPLAKAKNGDELKLPETFIDSPILESYPVIRIEQLNIDGQVGKDNGQGGTWTASKLYSYMREQAMRRFEVDNADKAQVEIKVDFILLGDTEEYKQYRGLQKLYLYDTVTVVDPTIELEQTLQVSEVTWDAINQRYTGITLGDVFNYSSRSIAGYQLSNGTIQYNKLSANAISRIKGA